MKEANIIKTDNYEDLPFCQFAEKAYLNYSMYVILDRALPQISDGLKPVQRRIIYSMSQLGLLSSAKFKKSARTVGDVLGKFHPHGDTACYEAMVLMAQPFSFRYPLIEGQGNFGDPNNAKSFAAMRYTESKLSEYSNIFLEDLYQDTIDWAQNFDGTMEEPSALPARLPNILLNGATGIAVGMATNILPHNLREVAKALICLIEDKNTSLEKICKLIKGPDFPTEAEIITPFSEIKKMYKTGVGKIKTRARFYTQDSEIIFTSLPYQASIEKIYEQISSQMEAKKLPMVVDIRDESDQEMPSRLVVTARSNRVDLKPLTDHLFASTDLEKTYSFNMNMIGLDGFPKVKNLLEVLTQWLEFRKSIVRRKLDFNLKKILDRLHIIEGFIIVFNNINKVIKIIRDLDQPKKKLMQTFSLTDTQAVAILDMKLRQLAKLQEIKLKKEEKILEEQKVDLEKKLSDKKVFNEYIKNEIKQDASKYGDRRRSPIKTRKEAEKFSIVDIMYSETVTVILSEKGWIRSAKGHEIDPQAIKFKSGDFLLGYLRTKSDKPVVFLDNEGRSYSLFAHSLPSARGNGEPLTGHLSISPNAYIKYMISSENKDFYLVASDNGYGFIIKFSDFLTNYKNGKSVISIKNDHQLLKPQNVIDITKDNIAAITSKGRLLIFPLNQLPYLKKGQGNKIIGFDARQRKGKNSEKLIFLRILPLNADLVIHSGKRFLKLDPENQKKYMSKRGYKGKKLLSGYTNISYVKVL